MDCVLRPKVKLTTLMKNGKKVPTLIYENDEKEPRNMAAKSATDDIAAVPFARSSQTVRRGCSSTEFDEENEFTNSPPQARRKLQFPWETFGTANRSTSSDNSQNTSQASTSFPTGIGAVTGKAAARIKASPTHRELSNSIIRDEELPHPSKLRKRKKTACSQSQSRKRGNGGMDVYAHVAQLRRKQAEFSWIPPSDQVHSLSECTELGEPAERSLQRVPGSPVFKRNHWTGLAGQDFYTESPVPQFSSNSCPNDDSDFKLSHELALDYQSGVIPASKRNVDFQLNMANHREDYNTQVDSFPSEVSWLSELQTSCGIPVADQTKEE